jgi:hypothetical protein
MDGLKQSESVSLMPGWHTVILGGQSKGKTQ